MECINVIDKHYLTKTTNIGNNVLA